MLADVDVMFVAQRSGAGNNFFPSKLLGIMAQAKPLLVAADTDSELGRVITQSGCGLVSPYGDTAELLANLNRLLGSRVELPQMGMKGRESIMVFDRRKVLGAWRNRIVGLCKR